MTGLSKIAVIAGNDGGLRMQLARWLAGFGIDSVHVATEDEARGLVDRLNPDLIFLTAGAGTPDILGFVARTVRLRGTGETRVMLCSRAGDAALLGAAVAEGADECLVAPFDADLLRFKLEQTGVLAWQ